MLAVGIGVWTIPREVQLEGDAAPADMKYAEDAVVAEQMLADEEEALDRKVAVAERRPGRRLSWNRGTHGSQIEEGGPKPPARTAVRSPANEPSAARVAQTPASRPAADMAAGGAEDSRSNETGREGIRSEQAGTRR